MTAGTATRTRVQKRWGDVSKRDLVEVKGRLYTVVKVKPKGKELKVTILDPETKKEYTSWVSAKHGVDVIELVKKQRKAWTAPDDDPAAKTVTEILGGKLVAVQPGEDECWIVPLVDPSTLAGHLHIFHNIMGVDVRGDYEHALQIHDDEHAQKKLDQLHQPHVHEADRPATEIGPRFQ